MSGNNEEFGAKHVSVPLVVYAGDERIVIGRANVNLETGSVTAQITSEVTNPRIVDRLKARDGEFSFGLPPVDKTFNLFKDVYTSLTIRGSSKPELNFKQESLERFIPKKRDLDEEFLSHQSPIDADVSAAIRYWYEDQHRMYGVKYNPLETRILNTPLDDVVSKEERDGEAE